MGSFDTYNTTRGQRSPRAFSGAVDGHANSGPIWHIAIPVDLVEGEVAQEAEAVIRDALVSSAA
jgi:hypothetical protein